MTDRNVILPVTARDRSQYGAPSWAKFKIIFRKDSNYPDFRGTKFYRNEEIAKNALIKKDKLIQKTKKANLKPPTPAKADKFLVKVGDPTKKNNVIKQKFKEVIGSRNVPETYKPTGVTKNLYRALITVDNKTVLSTDFGKEADAIKAVKDYRIKNPIKNPPPDLDTLDAQKKKRYLDKQAKSKAIKERGGYYSGPHTGTTKAHLGHTGNVFGIELITGDRLAYTPAEINQAMSAEGAGLDSKIKKVSEKIERLKKENLPPARKKKLLEQADALLVRLASQSQGFKKVTLSDGSTFGGDRLTLDRFNEFPGWTEREINEFVKKWKDKKTWDTAEEFENIKKAKLFDINRKKALKAAEKIGKTEQTKIIEQLNIFDNVKDEVAIAENINAGNPKIKKLLEKRVNCAEGCLVKVANEEPGKITRALNSIKNFFVPKPEMPSIKYDDTLGAFVNTTTDDVVSQAGLKAWAADNPMPVQAGTSVKPGLLRKTGRALAHIGLPLPTAAMDTYFIGRQIEEGRDPVDIAKDPFNWLGLATMEPLTKAAGMADKSGKLASVMRLGMSPGMIRGATRFLGLPGLAISTALTGYDQYKKYQDKEGFIYDLFNKVDNTDV